ncbi:AGAP011031PAlike, partial [Caligus rogercresseyi]
ISDVKFVVKRLHSSSARSSSLNSSRVRRSNSKIWRQTRFGCSTDTIHPKCLSESEDESKPINPRVEKLIKTILAQGESIQAELLRLSSAATSGTRSAGSGGDKDYLLQHYLGSIPERPEDSGCTSEERDEKSVSPALRISHNDEEINEADISFVKSQTQEEEGIDPGAIHLWTELFEKIFNMNQKLATQEEELNHLSLKMKSYLEAPESFVEMELQSASQELSRATQDNSDLGREIRRNEESLGQLSQSVDGRKVLANRLEMDVNRAESASIKLKKELAESSCSRVLHPGSPLVMTPTEKTVRFNDREQILSTPEPPPPPPSSHKAAVKKSILKVGPDGTPIDPGADSNSDTGLSSMHSSSSEDGSSPVTTAYGLDTLV